MGRRGRLVRLVALTLGLLGLASPEKAALARTVVADLTDHLIAIDTAFVGAEVVLFGAVDGSGDIAVVVRGPERREQVQRKERIAGVWLNRDIVPFDRVPLFYAVASSRPLPEIAPPALRARLGLGLDVLRLEPEDPDQPNLNVAAFRAGLIRNKQAADLYVREPGVVRFLGQRLFRTTLTFPANVPPGSYMVEAYHFRDGEVVGAQSSVLVVTKVGFEAALFDYATQDGLLYGLVALLIAVVSGWGAGYVFRRD